MKRQFSILQQQEIDAAVNHGLLPSEIKVMSKPYFNHLQMKELRLGFESGLSEKEVKQYAKRWLTPQQMEEFRKCMKIGDREAIPTTLPGGLQKNTWYSIGVLSCVCVLLFVAFLYLMRLEKPVLELSAEEITLSCGDLFEPRAYIIKQSSNPKAKLTLPKNVSTRVPKTFLALYELELNEQIAYRSLIVHVVDVNPPEIHLTNREVVLEEGQEFSCKAYVEQVIDDSGEDLKNEVNCESGQFEIGTHEIHYEVKDASHNIGEAQLTLIISQKQEVDEELQQAMAKG